MKVRFLGAHNTESKLTRMTSLLIDDVLAIDAGGLTLSLSFEEQLGLKAVLLTHQHFDHIRDIPSLGMNFLLRQASIDVYSIRQVRRALADNLINGQLYPSFLAQEKSPISFHEIEPMVCFNIGDYEVLPLPVNHSVEAVGYMIACGGRSVFFTGDTGIGLAGLWRYIAPGLLVAEVTAPDRLVDFVREKGHLTPSLLGEELNSFKEARGYLPQVVTVHMNPALEDEIQEELAALAERLGASIAPAFEGMEVIL
jgi:ribonuclease BN (tRNA processing enzyme)